MSVEVKLVKNTFLSPEAKLWNDLTKELFSENFLQLQVQWFLLFTKSVYTTLLKNNNNNHNLLNEHVCDYIDFKSKDLKR